MNTLAGTGGLVRLILRRDRVLLPLWVLLLALIPISYVSPFADLYPTAAARQQYADNAGFTTLYGRLSGTSLGEFLTWRLGFVPVMVGLLSLLTVIRHTRTEEEPGRRELLGATVGGGHARAGGGAGGDLRRQPGAGRAADAGHAHPGPARGRVMGPRPGVRRRRVGI